MSLTKRPALLCSNSTEDFQVLSPWLSELGIPLVPITDPAQTVREAKEAGCPLVLMDLEDQPRWQSTLRHLRRLAPATEVVVYTRCAEIATWLDALEAGAFDLLWKPFSRMELARVVAGLRRQRLQPRPAAA
jgi:DNA-binding response OmpR family regulator